MEKTLERWNSEALGPRIEPPAICVLQIRIRRAGISVERAKGGCDS
ncbi:hypothetical protein [Mesorhizobium sp. NFR06]|jgi:hypothetical protein|nr:hypothetical protein [Mesorhizobium sp. NFR06]